MKVSIIIPTYNSKEFLGSALNSIFFQSYEDIECVIIDGDSKDGTLDIIKKYKEKYKDKLIFISEKDNGVFDAINKGIKKSTGQVIGWMGADDFYSNVNVIEKAVNIIDEEKVEMCWGDLLYINRNNPEKILRSWKSCQYKKGMFQKGWQLPHFASFVRREIFDRYGYFNIEFKISADYDFFLRILEKNNVTSVYINEVFLKMRVGGQSNNNIKNIIKGNLECYNSWGINNLKVNFLKLFLPKPFLKIKQYFS